MTVRYVPAQHLDAAVVRLWEPSVRFRNGIVTGAGGKQVLAQDPPANPIELFEPTIPEAHECAAFTSADRRHA